MLKLFLLSSRAGGVFVVATLMAVQSSFAVQTLPAYELFPTTYANDARLGNIASLDAGNGVGSDSNLTNSWSAGLSYSGLVTSNNSGGVIANGTPTSNRDRGFQLSPGVAFGDTTNALYASFLLKIEIVPTTTNLIALFAGTTGGGATPIAGVYLDDSSRLRISKSPATPATNTTPALGLNTIHLVVFRYKYAAANNDEVALWLDPDSLGVDEQNVPPATILTTNGSDASSSIVAFDLSHRTVSGTAVGATGFKYLDEVRVATNWAGVTPTTGVVPPPSVPCITETLMTLDGLVLRGTNGSPNGVYQVLIATNVTAPPFQWSAIATNFFDTDGNFDCTNPVSPADLQRFYRLLVSGQIPPPPVAPSITTQPTNVTVTVGQNATFSVVAVGDPTLFHQWYFNTNTLLSNATHFSLTITNVQTTNEGTYFVVVTNFTGSATSTNATLTILPAPVTPFITIQPTNQTVTAGQPVTISVEADGTAPLRYQWFFNTNTALFNATNFSLTLASVHATNAGAYSVRVTNNAGSVTSTNAFLTVLAPPYIVTQPQNRSVTVSNDATFTVQAVGTEPLHYQWFFNTNTMLSNETDFSLTITNAQTNDTGGYSVVITNIYGSTTSTLATLTVNPVSTNIVDFSLFGFARAVTGGGIIAETDSRYAKVTNALDLANAVKSSTVKVIEIMNDLDLGWLEIGAPAQAVGPFRSQQNTPLLHPRLLQTGVSLLDIQSKNGLTIFSVNGATIRHACFNIKNAANVIVRNLKFDEMWEWDESTKGDYDRNDWDFIDLGNGGGTVSNIWVDQCTFTKAYDGICDIKGGAFNVTFSWNKYVGDDGDVNANSFVRQQINALEQSRPANPMYEFLRNNGFSIEDIVTILHGHDKTHLIGATALSAENALHTITFHHQWYMNPWDRLPRLRAGNVHNYNIYVDDTQGLAARRLRDARAAAMSTANRNTLNNTYNFQVFLNGSISTENGAVLVEKSAYIDCLTPLRNNQTDVNNPVYTGKIMALDTIYHFDNTSGPPTDFRGSSTNAPGDTYFGPAQATVIPFSWNLTNNVLPYTYAMDDPSQLQTILSNYAGAGVLTWAKTNWLKTSYSP
jgi:pectate lyase